VDFYLLRPEVAGGLGPSSMLDTDVHPPRVHRLHYEFADWMGDVLLETFPVFIIERGTGEAAQAAGLTGAELAPVETSVTPEGQEMLEMAGVDSLPEFAWLKVHGKPGVDDFGQLPDAGLVVSDRALSLLRDAGIDNSEVEPFHGGE
jgi:hypothetical protein